ncbi:MAG: FkbM family methyltransferase [Nitrososphaerota archaeon]
MGANIGIFTLLASLLVKDYGTVLAIEPYPPNIQCLQLMCEFNQLSNVHIVPVAVGSKNGKAKLHIDPQLGGHSVNIERSKKSIMVKVNTLDYIVKKFALPKVDFIKMDIEGAEADALIGAKETIQEYAPYIAMSAYHLPDDQRKLSQILKSLQPNYNTQFYHFAPDLELTLHAYV